MQGKKSLPPVLSFRPKHTFLFQFSLSRLLVIKTNKKIQSSVMPNIDYSILLILKSVYFIMCNLLLLPTSISEKMLRK